MSEIEDDAIEWPPVNVTQLLFVLPVTAAELVLTLTVDCAPLSPVFSVYEPVHVYVKAPIGMLLAPEPATLVGAVKKIAAAPPAPNVLRRLALMMPLPLFVDATAALVLSVEVKLYVKLDGKVTLAIVLTDALTLKLWDVAAAAGNVDAAASAQTAANMPIRLIIWCFSKVELRGLRGADTRAARLSEAAA